MACLDRDAQLVAFSFQVFHKLLYTGGNGSEIVVVQLLVLCAFVSQQGTFRQRQVGTGGIEVFVYQEILLFPA